MRSDRLLTALLAGAALFACVGCYEPPPIEFVPDDEFASAPTASDYSAEILYLAETFVSDTESWETTIQRHEVRKIFTSGGLSYAEFSVAHGDSQELVELRGRTVLADGTEYPLEPEHIFRSEQDGSHWVFMRMPRAEPGAVVELYYTLRSDSIWYDWTFRPARSNVPVRRYSLSVIGSDNISARLNSYVPGEAKRAPTRTDLGSSWRLSTTLQDIQPARYEPYAPPKTERQPRFHYRVRKIGSRTTYGHDWPSQMHWLAKDVYVEAEWADGFDDPGVPTCASPDEACVEEVVASVHRDLVVYRRAGLADAEPLGDVLAEGKATNYEAALLLFHRLRANDVTAYVAVGNGYRGGRLDESIPDSEWLNHAYVQVRFRDQRLWIDPSCARCALGEVPGLALENRAIVFRKNGDKTVTSVENVLATKTAPNVKSARYDVGLEATGRAIVLHNETVSGSSGERLADAWATSEPEIRDAAYERGVETIVRSSHPDVESLESTRTCNRTEGSCSDELRYVVAQLAQRVDDRLVLPLRVAPRLLSLDPRDDRRLPVELPEMTREAFVEVSLPEGHSVGHCPEPRNISVLRGAVTARFTCEVVGDRVQLRYALDAARSSIPVEDYAELTQVTTFFDDLRREAVVIDVPPTPEPVETPPAAEASSLPGDEEPFIDEDEVSAGE